MPQIAFPSPVAPVVAERAPRPFLRALRQACLDSPIVELRLDALPSVADIVEVLERVARHPFKAVLIATCRREADGGMFRGSPSAQMAVLELAVRAGCGWVDVDAATLESFPPRLRKVFLRRARRIVSFHDFSRTPEGLTSMVARARRLGAHLVKVAALAKSHGDVVRLLRLARKRRGRVIAVPMGPQGVAGRLLAVRDGSPLAYVSGKRDAAVAPGQLTLQEFREGFRAHKIDRRSRIYGVIGDPALHSLSPAMHNAAFRHARIRAAYLPFETRDLLDFLACLRDYGVSGFSVTAPFKRTILKHLDSLDPIAEMIGAVNTVLVTSRGRLTGMNTDYVGVLRSLGRRFSPECAEVLILGAGGSARACAFALATAGAYVTISARRSVRARELARAVGGEAVAKKDLRGRRFDVLINCTPVGQEGGPPGSPLAASEIRAGTVLDMVYRPLVTPFLKLARNRGARVVSGLDMLVEQGAAQFEIWTERRAPVGVMRKAARQALRAGEGSRR